MHMGTRGLPRTPVSETTLEQKVTHRWISGQQSCHPQRRTGSEGRCAPLGGQVAQQRHLLSETAVPPADAPAGSTLAF